MTTLDTTARQVLNRLKTVAGHVRGIQRMVETDAYCIDIIKQTQAVQRALDKISGMVLEEHLNGAVTDVLHESMQPERERVITELLDVFQGVRERSSDLPAPDNAAERVPQRLAWLEQIEQQVRDIQEMCAGSNEPIAIIAHVKAVQSMLDAFQRRVLADHLNGCVTTAIRSQQPAERARVLDELLQVFHTSSTL
jgi:DNA-binding FrmR family transcriptional regulator